MQVSDLERLLVELLKPLTPELLRGLIARREGLIVSLPGETRDGLSRVLESYGWGLRLLSTRLVVQQVGKLRPELRPELETAEGSRWMGREVDELKRLARERA